LMLERWELYQFAQILIRKSKELIRILSFKEKRGLAGTFFTQTWLLVCGLGLLMIGNMHVIGLYNRATEEGYVANAGANGDSSEADTLEFKVLFDTHSSDQQNDDFTGSAHSHDFNSTIFESKKLRNEGMEKMAEAFSGEGGMAIR